MASSKSIHLGNALYKVPKLEAAKQFYSNAFEVKTYFDEPGWVIFQIGGFQLWLVPEHSTEEHPEVYGGNNKPDGIIYWKVKDVDAVCQRFVDSGGTAHKKNTNTPFIEAIVEDPWGNRMGLLSDLY